MSDQELRASDYNYDAAALLERGGSSANRPI